MPVPRKLLLRVLTAGHLSTLQNTPVRARLQLRLARVQLRQGRRAEAANGFAAGLALALNWGDPAAFHGYLGLAELAMVQGDLATAFAQLGEAERLMQRQHVSETLYRGTLLLASSHLWIAQGHHERARLAVDRVLAYAQRVKAILPTPNFPELIPRLQLLGLQLDLAQGADVREALRQLRDQALSQGRQALLSELLLAYAEACDAHADQAAAEQARAEGQALRRRLGYQCLWFTVGNPLNECAVPGETANTLSQRELAVLQLIAQGCSNQEVAEQLFISLHTVKTHARRINGKLGVSRRTQAVAKAKALGLF